MKIKISKWQKIANFLETLNVPEGIKLGIMERFGNYVVTISKRVKKTKYGEIFEVVKFFEIDKKLGLRTIKRIIKERIAELNLKNKK